VPGRVLLLLHPRGADVLAGVSCIVVVGHQSLVVQRVPLFPLHQRHRKQVIVPARLPTRQLSRAKHFHWNSVVPSLSEPSLTEFRPFNSSAFSTCTPTPIFVIQIK
jgi:hypothetical protein